MDNLKEYYRILDETNRIALATSIDNFPNIRAVNFCYKKDKEGTIFFASFRGSEKTFEFIHNNNVAFTTVPLSAESSEHIRVKRAIVKKSNLSIYDLKDEFIKKHPDYKEIIEVAGERLDLYEISFKDALLILDLGKKAVVNF